MCHPHRVAGRWGANMQPQVIPYHEDPNKISTVVFMAGSSAETDLGPYKMSQDATTGKAILELGDYENDIHERAALSQFLVSHHSAFLWIPACRLRCSACMATFGEVQQAVLWYSVPGSLSLRWNCNPHDSTHSGLGSTANRVCNLECQTLPSTKSNLLTSFLVCRVFIFFRTALWSFPRD